MSQFQPIEETYCAQRLLECGFAELPFGPLPPATTPPAPPVLIEFKTAQAQNEAMPWLSPANRDCARAQRMARYAGMEVLS